MGEAERLSDRSLPIMLLRALYAVSLEGGGLSLRRAASEIGVGEDEADAAGRALIASGLIVRCGDDGVDLTERGRERARAAESRTQTEGEPPRAGQTAPETGGRPA